MPSNFYQTVKHIGISQKQIRAVIDHTLKHLKKETKEVSIHCIGEQRMKTLNTVFRGIKRPTDVLSFPTEHMFDGMEERDSGDLFLCPQYIQKQAKKFGTSYKEEFLRMLMHGVLHLEGFDHEKKSDATKMFSVQEKILGQVIKKH